jgi:hypothetical protein
VILQKSCTHIEQRTEGLSEVHSSLLFRSVENKTNYEWDLRIDLCLYCAGIARYQISKFADDLKIDLPVVATLVKKKE